MQIEPNAENVKETFIRSLGESEYDVKALIASVESGTPLLDLSLSSIDQLDFLLRLEDNFKIVIPPEDLSELKNFEDIASYIKSRKSASGGEGQP